MRYAKHDRVIDETLICWNRVLYIFTIFTDGSVIPQNYRLRQLRRWSVPGGTWIFGAFAASKSEWVQSRLWGNEWMDPLGFNQFVCFRVKYLGPRKSRRISNLEWLKSCEFTVIWLIDFSDMLEVYFCLYVHCSFTLPPIVGSHKIVFI